MASSTSSSRGSAHDDVTATQGYYQILVPNWGTDGASQSLSSFLRLGANPATGNPPTAWAVSLLQQFSAFFDDPRQRADGTTFAFPQTLPGVTGSEGSTAPLGLTTGQRADETSNLATKGGWYDHSDGNRITTTQGDKVEVIRGNYQLIVLGRQDELGNAAIFDASGGMLQPNDATPSNIMRLEWVRNYDGTWRIIEECQKGDVHTVIHGDVLEESYGQSITSITGSEAQGLLLPPETYSAGVSNGTATPPVTSENNDLFDPNSPAYLGSTVLQKRTNPVIVEKTWAQSISSYTGSDACWVPTIEEHTWAVAINSVTNAGAIADTTTSGVITSTTAAGEIKETTTAINIWETTAATSIMGTTTAGLIVDVTTAGVIAELSTGLHLGVEMGVLTEIFLGGKISLEAALGFSVALALKLDYCFGVKADLNFGPSFEFNTSAAVDLSTEKNILAGVLMLGL